jgi:hypothetical protein
MAGAVIGLAIGLLAAITIGVSVYPDAPTMFIVAVEVAAAFIGATFGALLEFAIRSTA